MPVLREGSVVAPVDWAVLVKLAVPQVPVHIGLRSWASATGLPDMGGYLYWQCPLDHGPPALDSSIIHLRSDCDIGLQSILD